MRLAHVFGCYKLALLFEIMLDYITSFSIEVLRIHKVFGKCLVWAWFRQTCLCSSMWGGYRIQIVEGWKWQRTFSYKWVRYAKADKDVALQYHYRCSTDTNVCGGWVLPSTLSVDEHKHSPARMRYSNNFCTSRTELQTDAAQILLWFSAKIPRLLNSFHRGLEVHLAENE